MNRAVFDGASLLEGGKGGKGGEGGYTATGRVRKRRLALIQMIRGHLVKELEYDS
jgi:hypothetical protein